MEEGFNKRENMVLSLWKVGRVVEKQAWFTGWFEIGCPEFKVT